MASHQPCVIQFNETSKPALVAPFDGCRSHETDMVALQGKRCLGLDGDWLLMLDELTRECSLMSFAKGYSPSSPTVISLPPLPEDTTPPSDLSYGCAISNQTPPDCTVILDYVGEKSLLYCRPGDNEWSRLPVEFPEKGDLFDGPITPGHQGKVYATTMVSVVAVDSSSLAPVVERTGIRHPPACPVHDVYKCFPVSCPDSGELFLVRCCISGSMGDFVDAKVFRRNLEDNLWETVESIGDRTFFLGRYSFAVSSAFEAGSQPNCAHVLRAVRGEIGIYTMSLDDMTISLSIVWAYDDDEDETFWALPTSFGLESRVTDADDLSNDQVNQKRIEQCWKEEEDDTDITEERQWCDLHTDLLQLLVTKVSFIDFLHMKAVCKQWNSIACPIQDAKVSPLLMTTRPARAKDLVEIFDPVSEKKYIMRLSIPDPGLKSQGSQLLHFAKNGWLIVSRGGDQMFFLVNPFKNYSDGGDVIALPPLDVLGLKGLSFSSVPGSPDFVVLAAGITPDGKVVMIHTWRIGDKDWKEELLSEDDYVPFLMASHSPVFLDNLFYFLDINGRLGVVDPNEEEMEWNVLDPPIGGNDEEHRLDWDYSYLVEWKRVLINIVREKEHGGYVRMFRLDRSRMVWSELERMEDMAVFWDRSNALIAMPPHGEDSCNKMFLPNYNETKGGGRTQAFYSFKK